jgi:hypothetical protein
VNIPICMPDPPADTNILTHIALHGLQNVDDAPNALVSRDGNRDFLQAPRLLLRLPLVLAPRLDYLEQLDDEQHLEGDARSTDHMCISSTPLRTGSRTRLRSGI